jgi:hypothetical protein
MDPLRISENRRFIQHQDGRPFFYLADTAWELFHALNREEARRYLENRVSKGFTAIQAVVLAELDGLTEPNAYGQAPLEDKDPTRPVEAYFEHVDFVVRTANKLGLYIAMLPTWGAWLVNHPIFNLDTARQYGRFLGKRYKDADIIWVLGGDRSGEGVVELWRSMAAGIAEGDGGRGIKTFHPNGGGSSARWVHNEAWLDFNMIQSGHGRPFQTNWRMIDADCALAPTKPTLDGEPCYENHPVGFNRKNWRFGDYHVRVASYWSVFHGGCGITYGCHDIWMMHKPGRLNGSFSFNYWFESLDLSGTFHMQHLRRLMESRPYFTRIPDQAILAGNSQLSDHMAATRDGTPGNKDATYLMVYTPLHRRVSVDSSVIAGGQLNAWWYDVRDGRAIPCASDVANEGKFSADTPDHPQYDWVLVVDDAGRGYPPPGQVS